jgi:hypothetical protein
MKGIRSRTDGVLHLVPGKSTSAVTHLGNRIFLGGPRTNKSQVTEFLTIVSESMGLPMKQLTGRIVEVAPVEDAHFGLLTTLSLPVEGGPAVLTKIEHGYRYIRGTVEYVQNRYPTLNTLYPPKIIIHIPQGDDDLADEGLVLQAAYDVLYYQSLGYIIWIHCKSGMGRSNMFAMLIRILMTQKVHPMDGSTVLAHLLRQVSVDNHARRGITQIDPPRLVQVLDYAKAFFRRYDRIPTSVDVPYASPPVQLPPGGMPPPGSPRATASPVVLPPSLGSS